MDQIQVKWILENRILLYRSIGDQTLESVQDAVSQIHQRVAEGDPPVHIILDSRYTGRFPPSIKAISTMMQKHNNSGHVVQIGGTSLTKFIANVLTKLSGSSPLEFRNTVEEAIYLFKSVDSTVASDFEYKDFPPEQVLQGSP